jgi:hypothetical protein
MVDNSFFIYLLLIMLQSYVKGIDSSIPISKYSENISFFSIIKTKNFSITEDENAALAFRLN